MTGITVEALLAGSGLPRSEALLLLAHAAGARRERLIAGSLDAVEPATVDAFRDLATRRAHGEPIAYLVGRRDFYGRSFDVDPRVLIPRPETELLVERAIEWIDTHRATRILDLGTGSGAIALCVALERPACEVVATDASDAALTVARANAARLGARVAFAMGDWFRALPRGTRFDLIVSNPPYVAAGDPHLAIGDLRFEPSTALTDGADGLAAIREIVAGAGAFLAPDAMLMLEHGAGQDVPVRALLTAAGFAAVASFRDLAGIERVTSGVFGAADAVPRGDL